MTAQNLLDHSGIFKHHPLAELLVEIAGAGLDGSLRLSDGESKVIVYLSGGRVIFAVSNARSFRLFDILLSQNKITKEALAAIPNFTNDMELAKALVARKIFSREYVNSLFAWQVSSIIANSATWQAGEWTFSPLARLRDGISFPVDLNKILLAHARSLSDAEIVGRFKSLRESFKLRTAIAEGLDLSPHEAFVLTRFTDSALTVDQIKDLSGLPDSATFRNLYALWLGGFLTRSHWDPAFSDRKLDLIRSARLELKKEAAFVEPPKTEPVKPEPVAETPPAPPETGAAPVEEAITLDDYLARSEAAKTHYEAMGVDVKAEASEVKQAYFNLAKRFHPDHFHHENDRALVQRVQTSFTRLAQAYETLKTPESREAYDFKMRKELAEQDKRAASGATTEEISKNVQDEQAHENYEQGFSLLMDEEYEAATPFLARAVFFAPDNARFHAYYGKALSFDEKQRHKAESEMQTAIKLDADNPTFRIILAEFFIQMGMVKRADGELSRLLQIFPSNHEAKTLLDSLRGK